MQLPRHARRILALLPALILVLILAEPAGAQETLVNGKKITVPALGTQFGVGSLPMNMVSSPDGRYAIVSDMGDRESLWSVSSSDGKGVSHLDFARGGRGDSNGLYYGLVVDKNGTLYVSQGASHKIAVIKIGSDGALTQSGSIPTKENDFPAGLALDDRGYLYAVNKEFYNSANADDVRKGATPSGVVVYSPAVGKELGRVTLPSQEVPSAAGPISPPGSAFAAAALADGSKIFVSSQRDGVVYDVSTITPIAPRVTGQIATGSHPDSLLLSADQTNLYVANAGSDTVSVVDTQTDQVRDTILLRPDMIRGLPGATPTGLALSPNQKTLYVTLGDMNAVAVVDLVKDRLQGYIPVGWYPSAVLAGGGKLMVANAYGTKTRNPNGKPVGTWGTYVLSVIEGDVSTLSVPAPRQLTEYTAQVLANNRVSEARVTRNQALAAMGMKPDQIKHVIYIIKENRTYDQMLGDESVGNGDPSLVMFGKQVTPNQHALAERFVLLDNFYDCGEVSGIGWPWSTQGLANEYVVKNVPYNYSGRDNDYDFEGQVDGYPVGGFPARDPYDFPLSTAFPKGAPAIPDVSEAPGGHLWDLARKAGLTYRNYGFFYTFGVTGVIPDNYPDSPGIQPAGHDLGGISDIDFRRFDNDYPDSDAPAIYYGKDHKSADLYPITSYGHYKVSSRYAEWKREFDEMLAKDPSGASVPALMTIRMPHDHTQGARSNSHSPRAEVADNDYGVGEIVEAVSHSPIWSSTAIFVIEDDAQDGQDHVDCHRSICFVVSPWIKKSSVDHGFYNTDSVLRTMELFLGLPAMSQYDGVATPIGDWDSAPNNSDPYAAILPDESIIAEHNLSADSLAPNDPRRRLALLSDKMDFTLPDRAPAQQLNQILWQTVKGTGSVSPAPRFGLALPSDRRGANDGDGDD